MNRLLLPTTFLMFTTMEKEKERKKERIRRKERLRKKRREEDMFCCCCNQQLLLLHLLLFVSFSKPCKVLFFPEETFPISFLFYRSCAKTSSSMKETKNLCVNDDMKLIIIKKNCICMHKSAPITNLEQLRTCPLCLQERRNTL